MRQNLQHTNLTYHLLLTYSIRYSMLLVMRHVSVHPVRPRSQQLSLLSLCRVFVFMTFPPQFDSRAPCPVRKFVSKS